MTALTSRRIALLKPVPCPVCGDKRVTAISEPGRSFAVLGSCLACVWHIPIGKAVTS